MMQTELPAGDEDHGKPGRVRRRFRPFRGAGGPKAARPARHWPIRAILVVATLLVVLIMGGGAEHGVVQRLVAELAGIALLVGILPFVSWKEHFRRDRFIAVLAILLAVLFVAQLVPLPPSAWSGLGGRAIFTEGDGMMFHKLLSRPLSLEPDKTVAAALVLVPGIALWLGLARWPERGEAWIMVYLGFIVFSFVFAMLQMVLGSDTIYLHYDPDNKLLTGTFANRNHQAEAMDCAIALAAGLHVAWARGDRLAGGIPRIVRPVAPYLFPFMAVLGAVGALITGSRVGAVLLVASLLASIAMVYGPALAVRLRSAGQNPARLVGLALVVLLAVAAGIAALATIDPGGPLAMVFSRSLVANDQRYRFWPVAWQMVSLYAPWGSGIGTFRRVFEISEPSRNLIPAYINQAHNDWMQVLIEAGIPGMALALAFVGWLALRTRAAWRDRQPLAQSASVVILLLLAHSTYDYPLRTVTLCATLFACVALLAPRGGAQPAIRSPLQPEEEA